MYRDRLIELKRVLENIPEDGKFDMGAWCEATEEDWDEEELRWSCGYAGCALGWAANHRPFNALGLGLVEDCGGLEVGYHFIEEGTPIIIKTEGYVAGMKFFDIPYVYSTFLFDPDLYDDDYEFYGDDDSVLSKMSEEEREQFIAEKGKNTEPADVIKRIDYILSKPDGYIVAEDTIDQDS